jgi:endogenous inhibitor of DNA gyrase (YacG/DUF329 family)
LINSTTVNRRWLTKKLKMNRPFDYIKCEKIDVNNPAHQEVVIQRNKKLQKAVESGISLYEFILNISYEFQCPNCGTLIQEDESIDDRDFYEEIVDVLPKTIECDCCDAQFYLKTSEQKYTCKIPKTVQK